MSSPSPSCPYMDLELVKLLSTDAPVGQFFDRLNLRFQELHPGFSALFLVKFDDQWDLATSGELDNDDFPELPWKAHQGPLDDFAADPKYQVHLDPDLGTAVLLWSQSGDLQQLPDPMSSGLFDSIRLISTRLRSSRTLQMQKSQLQHMAQLATIGEMTASLAHEVANPLSVIMNNNNLLKRQLDKPEPVQEKLVKYSDKISKLVDRALAITTSIRRMARQESPEEREAVPVNRMLHEVYDLCHYRVSSSGSQLELDSSCENEWYAFSNSLALSQSIIIILNNAADYHSEADIGQDQKWVKIRVEQDDEQIFFKISNGGETIPKSIRKKIFNRYFTTKQRDKGVGIGLDIALQMMQRNSGSIFLDEVEDHTTFVVTVPKLKKGQAA